MSEGHTCFLDVENLEQLTDLPMVVAGCDAFVLVLSDGIFESQYCLKELAAAVLAGVQIVLVTKEGSRWPNKDGLLTESFPPPEVISKLEPAACQEAFSSSVAITHSNEYYTAFCHNLQQRIAKIVKANREEHGEPQDKTSGVSEELVLLQRTKLLDKRTAKHESEPAARLRRQPSSFVGASPDTQLVLTPRPDASPHPDQELFDKPTSGRRRSASQSSARRHSAGSSSQRFSDGDEEWVLPGAEELALQLMSETTDRHLAFQGKQAELSGTHMSELLGQLARSSEGQAKAQAHQAGEMGKQLKEMGTDMSKNMKEMGSEMSQMSQAHSEQMVKLAEAQGRVLAEAMGKQAEVLGAKMAEMLAAVRK